MKQLRAWLLPIITVLVVLTVTLLPQHLSRLQDQKVMAKIHSEALAAENILPAQSPDLEQRVSLLSRWMEDSVVMSAQNEVAEGDFYDDICAEALQELRSMADDGPLPADLLPPEVSFVDVSRMYLQQQLVGAEFYVFDAYSKIENINLWMVLDGETMELVWLELGHPAMEKYRESISPAEMGTFFLDRLGIENTQNTHVANGSYDAVFQLPATDLQYCVSLDPYYLKVFPSVAYPAMDAESMDAEDTDSYTVVE